MKYRHIEFLFEDEDGNPLSPFDIWGDSDVNPWTGRDNDDED